MSNEERVRILRMVSAGTLTPEEALGLLEVLHPRPLAEARPAIPEMSRSVHPRSLVIRVSEGDEPKVNLRLPLGLAQGARRFIPRRVQTSLAENGINLEEVLGDLSHVSTATLLEVRGDEDHVLIAVE